MSFLNSQNNEREDDDAEDYSAEEALARQREQGINRERPYEPRIIEDEFKTGNVVVDAIGTIQLQGMLIDRNWFRAKEFQTEDGAATLVDILVYGNLVDWHRPRKSNDTTQPDGTKAKVVCWKKFPQDHFVTTYAHMGAALGLKARQVEDAIERQVKGREVEIGGKKQNIKPTIGKRAATKAEAERWKLTHSGNDKPIVVWPFPDRLRQVSKRQELKLPGLKADLDTGNDIVNALWTIGLVGDVIDWNWLVHPRMRTGKTKNLLNITALFTLANIFYWNTPTEHFDENNGQQLPSTTKFAESAYTVTYDAWAESTFLTTDQLRKSVKFLHAGGIIQREIGAVYVTSHKAWIASVVFITPNVADVLDLTFGPFDVDEKGRPARRSNPPFSPTLLIKKHLKNIDNCNRSIFDPDISPEDAIKSASGIYRPTPDNSAASDSEYESASGIYRPLPAEFTDHSQRNLPTFIETFVEAPLQEQQQQASVVVDFDDKSSGAAETQTPLAIAMDEDAAIARRRETVIAKLLSFETGCWKKKIVAAATHRLEHAELWARHWPTQNESDPLWWIGHASGANPGIALGKRLDDESWLPPEVVKERRRAELQAEAARKRDEANRAAALVKRQQNDAMNGQREFARETFARYAGLSGDVAASASALCETNNFQFSLVRFAGGRLDTLIDLAQTNQVDHGVIFGLASALDVAIDRALELVIEAATASALEEIEREENLDDEPAMPSLLEHLRSGGPSAIVDELTREARDGMTRAEFEAARGDYTLAEWEVVRGRVERAAGVSLGEAPAAAAVAAPDDDAAALAEAERADGLWARMSGASKNSIEKDVTPIFLDLPPEGQTEDARIELRRALVCDWWDAPYNPPKRDQNQGEEAQSA